MKIINDQLILDDGTVIPFDGGFPMPLKGEREVKFIDWPHVETDRNAWLEWTYGGSSVPLKKGSSPAVKKSNFKEFHQGKTFAHTEAKFGKKRADKQAVAVVLSEARKGKKK